MTQSNPQAILDPLGWLGTGALIATLVWALMNPRIRALARLTVLESIRRMEFQGIMLLAVVLIAGMGYLLYTPEIKNLAVWNVVIDRIDESGGLTAPGVTQDPQALFSTQFDYYMQSAMAFFAEIFTLFICLTLGIFLISGDIAQGFLQTVLPKPLTRGEYLWGRGLGLCATVSAAWLVMGIEIFLLFAAKNPGVFTDSAAPEWKILWSTALLLAKWASFIAILFFCTLRLPPVIGGFVALMLAIGGHVAVNVWDVATDLAAPTLLRAGAWLGYVLMPHYDRAWSAIILDPTMNAFQRPADFSGFLGWAWTYSMVAGVGAWLIFRRRDL